MLVRPLNAILGSVTKVQILRALLPLTSPASGRETQRLAGIRSKGALQSALNDLSDLGILRREQTRGSHLYRINHRHELYAPLATLFEAEATRMQRLRTMLHAAISENGLEGLVVSIILYGSNARGSARPASDADLLVLAGDESAVETVEHALAEAGTAIEDSLGARISAYVVPRARAEQRLTDGDPLMQDVASEGRLLYGEPFPAEARTW
ncbi:MAG: hypothetical protein JWM27_1989 [Gemmatimonadetes bacterium]|nr:hypothetical protein [Gemmatimonadota bacterium]